MKKFLVKINNKCLKYPVNGFILGVSNYSNCFGITFNTEQIEEIVKKHSDKEIFVSLNKIITNDELIGYKDTLERLDKLNLSGIIVGDVAALTYGLKTNLMLEQGHLNNSSLTINHYNNNGCNGVILTNDITLDEINNIKKHTKAVLFKQVFGLQHLSSSMRRLVSNYLEFFEIDKRDKHYFIKENKSDNYYNIIEDNGTHIFGNKILNLITELDKMNVDYFILDGYLIAEEKFDNVVNAYLNNDKSEAELINEEFDADLGFINTKTMYKVKNNE